MSTPCLTADPLSKFHRDRVGAHPSALDTETSGGQYLRSTQKGERVVKLSGLIEGMCRLTGFPQGTVALAARHLREAGLISQGGRGPGAANMTYTDAANLLLGLAGSLQVVEAVEVVRFGRQATLWKEHEAANTLSLPGFETNAFGDTLDAILRILGENEDLLDASGEPVTVWFEIDRTTHYFSFNPTLVIDAQEGTVRFRYSRNSPAFDGAEPGELQGRAREVAAQHGFHGIRIKCEVDQIVLYGLADLISGRKGVDELWPAS